MMKKKWISFFLAAAMVAQAAVPVMAADGAYGMEDSQEAAQSRMEASVKSYLPEEAAFQADSSNQNAAPKYEIPAEDLDFFKALGSAAMTVSFKTENTGLQSLMVINGSTDPADYISLYISGGSTIGVELRRTPTNNDHRKIDVSGVNLANGKWHTVTFTVAKDQYYKIYLDGQEVFSAAASSTNFTDTMEWEPTSVTFGGAKRISGNNYQYTGSLKDAKFYNTALSEEEILMDHGDAQWDGFDENTVKTEEYGIFDMGDFDAFNYRIPALVTTAEGTLIAAADQRNTHWNDNGNIDTVIRRSTDNGKTWQDSMDVIDLKTQKYFNSQESSYTIDPTLLAEDESGPNPGRVWMLVDLFPECSGTWASEAGSGYLDVDGEKYLALYDTDKNVYTVRENGMVYDASGQATDYTVRQEMEMPFHEYGDLYKGSEYVGNILLRSTAKGNDTAPLTIYLTNHLVLTYSDDDGITWSKPIDLNSEVKEEWMKFIGTGPGAGIQLKNGEHAGRLIFPIYYTNGANKQSSANIYSDDGGQTWHRGESPNDGRLNSSGTASNSQEMNGLNELTESQIVELNNGHLMQFMRNTGGPGKVAVAVSEDGGETWGQVFYTEATEVYCQLSVVHYPQLLDGNECVIMSNPGGGGRTNGTLRIGKITSEDTIEWIETKMFCPGNYAYSCLTVMDNGHLGLLYEHSNTIKFTSFNIDFIKDPINMFSPTITEVSYEAVRRNPTRTSVQPGDTLNITVKLDQRVFTTGSPALRININGTYRKAQYVSGGNGNNEMLFSYVVQKGDAGSVAFKGPKIVCDESDSVKNKQGLTVSSGDLDANLGYIGYDPTAALGEVPVKLITASAGSAQSGQGAEKVLDGDENSLWHTSWGGAARKDHWISFDLGSEYTIKGFRYLPRHEGGINGIITKYRIEVSSDGSSYVTAAEGTWLQNAEWKSVAFEPVNARYVRLISLESASGESNEYSSAAEIRLLAEEFENDTETPDAPDGLQVTDITRNSALVNWEPSIDNVGVTGYRVSYGIVGQEMKQLETDAGLLSVRLENLEAGMAYEVQVSAFDQAGNISAGAAASFRTEKEADPDPKPGPDPKPEPKPDPDPPVERPAELKAVKLSNGKKVLGVKEKFTLKVSPQPSQAKLGSLSWKSSNKKVAQVNGRGLVTAKGTGKATITVTAANGRKASCKITVRKAPRKVELKAKKTTLRVKKTLQLKAVLSKGSAGSITYKSSNKKVADVSAKGKVTAKKKGTVKITVRTYNNKKDVIRLRIR